jgi:predicted Zn finger-like uncharacterized protein
MYTQCQHCKAIFEVSMREVTIAAGKLRCGECNEVFDAMLTLSTTLPEPFSAGTDTSATASDPNQTKQTLSINDAKSQRPEISQATGIKENVKDIAQDINKSIDRKWVKPIALSLAILLFAQVLYNNRQYFSRAPAHEPDKIEMLSNNVFAHPNETGVLLISASIQNHAKHAQPYPILEVRLTDSNNNLVALRRFKPSEYLETYHKKMLLETNKPTNLKLKIKDPGDRATRFQFKFM